MNMPFPLQPIEDGRFVPNRIVQFLLDISPTDLNLLAVKRAEGEFTKEEFSQFAQLIGYSLNGFAELSYVSNEEVEAAQEKAESGMSETAARNKVLREKIRAIHEQLVKLVEVAYDPSLEID